MTQLIIPFLSILMSIFTITIQSNEIKVIHKKLKIENGERNSPALNNFLKDVLKAKDELKWIDQMIYPQMNSNKYPETRRKLLATRDVRAVNRKRHWDHDGNYIKPVVSTYDDYDDDEDYQDYFDNDNDFYFKNRNRRLNLHNDGVLEYNDYDIDHREKCKPVKDRGILIKKMNNKTEQYVEPKTVFLSPKNFNSRKFSFKRNSLQFKNDLQNDDSNDDDDDDDDDNSDNELMDNLGYGGENYKENQVKGHEARYHRDQDHEAQLALAESDSQDDNQKYKRTIQDDDISNYLDDIPLDLSSPEIGNTSSSGSDYHALKATDDMFKGGIEQGNSIDDKIDTLTQISNTKPENYDPDYLNKNQWFSYLKLSKNNNEKPVRKIDISLDKKINKKVDSREKRLSVNGMPIMHHESIVEPSNWPWEYYDDKDDMRIKFGRGLMQVSNKIDRISVKSKNNKIKSRNYNENLKFKNSTSHRFSFPSENKIYYKKKFKLTRFARELENKNEDKFKDVSQIHFRVNAALADEIVDKIFEQVEKNEALKRGLKLQRNNKFHDKIINQTDDKINLENEEKTEEIIKKVKELLSNIVMEEFKEKTCLKLPSHLQKFLVWLVDNKNDAYNYTKYKVQDTDVSEQIKEEQKKILFPKSRELTSPEIYSLARKSAETNTTREINSSNSSDKINNLFGELHEKMKLLKRLLRAYHFLSHHEQKKVKAVHDYLKKQLKLLEKYNGSKENVEEFSTITAVKKMSSNKLFNKNQENLSEINHDNDTSLLSLFSNELTNKNKPRNINNKEDRKVEKFLNINFRQKRDMKNDSNSIEKLNNLKKITLPLGSTSASDEYMYTALKECTSSECKSKVYDKWNKKFINKPGGNLAHPDNQSSIKYNEYILTTAFPSSALTLIPSASVLSAFSYNPTINRNRLTINNKNNQIKIPSITYENLKKNNKMTQLLNTFNYPTTEKNSFSTLKSAKFLESKINIFPVPYN
ncbi:protein PFC0760c-like isoform X2 [Microplitis mediator]|uniref:protein PFC0760c-like isoform X2 n=1 Tax=Microplitis mediator TaxID=375433 RepID=UPI00255501E9|nr:protein PFC0760c-like isoform X2 [Microplitis mediator]